MTSSPDTTAFEAFEAAGWEQQAAGYAAFFPDITSNTAGPLLDAARVTAGDRLLDVGTGPGVVAGEAAARGAVVTAVDISEAMLAIARTRYPEVVFRAADAHALPFADASFDAVTANFALLHFGRPEIAVSELARVLRSGGGVAVTTWDHPEHVPLLGAVLSALERCGAQPPADLPSGPAFFRFADDGELRAVLSAAGLVDIGVDTVRFTHAVHDPDDLWRGVMGGTVRTSALVLRQPPTLQAELRSAFVELVETYRGTDGIIELPISVKLASATAP